MMMVAVMGVAKEVVRVAVKAEVMASAATIAPVMVRRKINMAARMITAVTVMTNTDNVVCHWLVITNGERPGETHSLQA